MAISTTTFGVYFYLMSQLHSTSSLTLLAGEEPHADLTWLALASMAIFITGEVHRQGCRLSDSLHTRNQQGAAYHRTGHLMSPHHCWSLVVIYRTSVAIVNLLWSPVGVLMFAC